MTTSNVTRPPVDGVRRQAPFALRADTNDEQGDGLTLDGYGAVFNRDTVIDSWEGRFRERIAPGAMKRSFHETPPRIQFDHGHHPTIGSIPIAKLERIAEEVDPVLAPEGGAHVVARMFDNWLMAPVRDAIAAGAIDGMSFRFSVVSEQWHDHKGNPIKDEPALLEMLRQTQFYEVPDDELPVRTLKQLKVPEIGPVVWPAYTDTSVSVRSKVIDLGRLNDPEQRRLLAQAVFLADTADSSQRSTEPSVGERLDDTRDDFPVKSSGDAQRSTTPVGERPSTPRKTRAIDLMVRKTRDTLLTISQEGKTL